MRENPEQFIDKKRQYFVGLGLRMREALRLHKKAGLWERKDGNRDWGSVSEHCLVEVARVDILADKLNLPEDIRKNLNTAAALHDFFKKGEKEIVTSEGLSWDSFEKASEESTRQMREAGFNERIIRLANSIGHGSLVETESILNKESLSSEDVAYLVLHYVDDYTIGSDWANPIENIDDKQINDLDRRVDKNKANQRYARLNEEGRTKLSGETAFEAQRRIGHLVEEKLATLIAVAENTDQIIDPKELPQFIDREIQSKIAGL